MDIRRRFFDNYDAPVARDIGFVPEERVIVFRRWAIPELPGWVIFEELNIAIHCEFRVSRY